MQTKYLILGLIEQSFLTGASLSHNGITEYKESTVFGSNLGVYDTIDEAINETKKLQDTMYLGIEIKTIYTIN